MRAVGGDAADLRLLAEGEDVGLDAELLEGPHRAGDADAGLHLVEDEQELVLVGERGAGCGRNSRAEVVVAALALDRLDDERRDVVAGARRSALLGSRATACRSAALDLARGPRR